MKSFRLMVAVLVVLFVNLAQARAEILTVIAPNESYMPGTSGIHVDIEINNVRANDIAGASFKVTYDKSNLRLTGVSSDFFDTVSWNSSGVSDGALIAGARGTAGTANPSTLVTLVFSIDGSASEGLHQIGVSVSRISNPSAGYNSSTALPVLVGINYNSIYMNGIDVNPDNIRVNVDDEIDENDIDGDGIPDQWERNYLPAGTAPEDELNVFSTNSDYERDGYSDYWEYRNGTHPLFMNSPGGNGYNPVTDKRIESGSFPLDTLLPSLIMK